MPDVSIRGGGMAACCAVHLLRRAGWSVGWRETTRPRLPAVLLSESAQRFISGVFEQKSLFDGGHRITRRVVAWGGRDPVTLDHSAVVVSEEHLLDRARPPGGESSESARWTILSASAPETSEHRFGTRSASVRRVEVKDGSLCAIESLAEGWLFLVPDGAASGWLLEVGEASLAGSRVIAGMVRGGFERAGEFPAYPRIRTPLAGAGWLSCGSAAMGFDPICGDGTGNAVREAILAAAVIGAALEGADAPSLIAHYEARLKLGFKRHLDLCRGYYRSGGAGAWWAREGEALERGMAWCGPEPRFEYQLKGYDLFHRQTSS